VDYGYWYRPDGRSPSEQEEFFQFEMKPQALELAFTQALNIPFEVSCDNLSGEKGDVLKFAEDVSSQLSNYRANGLPPRAAELLQVLVSQSAGK
jgi:elongation factor P hydroxylase